MTRRLTRESCGAKYNSLVKTLARKPCIRRTHDTAEGESNSWYEEQTFLYEIDRKDPYNGQPNICIFRTNRNKICVWAVLQMSTCKDFLQYDNFWVSGSGEISYSKSIAYEEEIEDARRMILDMYARIHYKVARDLFGPVLE